MNEAQALYQFWASFGIPAIDEQSAYDTASMEDLDIDYPYISYESAVSEFDDRVTLSADLWYRSMRWTEIEAKAQEIAQRIGQGGVKVNYQGGQIWITRGSPIYRRMSDENEFNIRRIHININAEFTSAT